MAKAKSQPEAYSRKNWQAVERSMRQRKASEHPVMATLYAEHRYMATLMKLVDEQIEAMGQGEAVDSRVLYESLHYMTHYPDAFHHPREDMVYQRAGDLDPSLADSVDTLQREHDYLAELGEKVLAEVVRWQDGEIEAKTALKPARDYVAALYKHMNVEEKLIFPQIEELLTEDDWHELEQEDLITPVADPVFGPKVGREYRNIARKARRVLRRGAEDAALVEWIGLEALLEGYELLSIAMDNGRQAAREHMEAALEETGELVDTRGDNGGLLLLPLRCAANGTRRYVDFLRDLGELSKDTLGDLSELGKGTRDRMRLVRTESPSDAKH